MKKIFRFDTYRTFRFAFFNLGLVLVFFYGIIFVKHIQLSWDRWYIFLALLLPLFNPQGYYFDYIFIEDQLLCFKRTFSKKVIAIKDITELIYERRIGYHFLVIRHLKQCIAKKFEENVEFFNTKTINELNQSLTSVNPSIVVTIDKSSRWYQEKNKNLHEKAPQTKLEWVAFGLKWTLIGMAVFGLIFFYNQFVKLIRGNR